MKSFVKSKFVLAFVVILFISYAILSYEKKDRINEYLEHKTSEFDVMYSSIFKLFEEEAEIIFDTIIDKQEIYDIYAQIDKENNDLLRQKLYDLLKDEYQYYQKVKLKQLHFHKKDNKSFLRMHLPSKHSDDLTKYRETVAYVNQHKKYISGFEAGKIYSGWRFVFPLIRNNQHYGSVEVSFDILAILTKFMDSYKTLSNFHINKKVINYKTWDEFIKKYYMKSPFKNYYLETDIVKELKKRVEDTHVGKKKLQDKNAKKIALASIEHNKPISIYDNYLQEVFTFLPVINKVTNEVVAFFSVRSDGKFIKKINQDFYIFMGLIAIFTILLLYLVYRIISSKDNINRCLQTLVDEKTKELSDINQNLEAIAEERTQELRKKRLKYKNLMSLSSDGIFIMTRDTGRLVEFSNKVESLLGYSKEELVNLTVKDWDKNIKSDEDYQKIVSTVDETPIYFERIHTRKDGSIYHAGITAVKINLEDEEYTYASVRDISEQKILRDILTEQKFELETIFNTNKDGIAILDLETNFLFCNTAYTKMTGFTQEELLTKSCKELSAKEDIQRAGDAIQKVIEEGSVENFEKTCIVKNGRRIMINMSLALMPDHQRILISTKNITDIKRKERQINEYVQLIDKNIITSTTDLEGNIIYVSEAFCNISGFTKDELIGQNHRIIKDSDQTDQFYKNIWDTISKDQVWKGEIKNRKKDGGFYWVEATINPIYNETGKKIGYTAIRQDITNRKLIEEISILDPLTSIYNRRYFNDLFPKVINSAKRKQELISFIMMDVDHFKQYNDTYGHQMGDKVLINVAKALKDSLHRADDYCFRLGGEEFGVIFQPKTQDEAYRFANRIKENIENLQIEHSKNSASDYITVSIGLITQRGDEVKNMDELYKEADSQLYKAKEEGRNRVSS